MALIVSEDRQGAWAAVECESPGCGCHVSIRPAVPDWSRYEMACTAFDMAQEDGWSLDGATYCPNHAPARRERTVRLRDGFDWARVVLEPVEPVKGSRRLA